MTENNIPENEVQNNTVNPTQFKSFFSYLKARFKNTPVGMRYQAFMKHMKKYFVIAKVFKWIRRIITFVQASAFVIIYATFIIILIPILLCFILFYLVYSLFRFKKYNKLFSSMLKTKELSVHFLGKHDDEFIDNDTVLDLPPNETVHLIAYNSSIISPLSAVKSLGNNTYRISMSYYYSLKRRVLDKADEETKSKINYFN